MNLSLIKSLLAGATMLAAWTIAFFFWRFWHKTRDRLFVFFALAFLLLGIERLCLGLAIGLAESYFYLFRLCAFLIIIYAIIDKNKN
jgi:hypothetical protein